MSKISTLLIRIVKKYPFSQADILKNILKTFPHHASNFEQLIVYQKFAYHICEKLLKQCAKDM